jgi:rhomboid family GlyGly-CTERM serine protease
MALTDSYAWLQRYLPWPCLVLLVPAGLIQLAGLPVTELLRYEREAIAAGELWRLLTAHLVHLGPMHLALNALAFWLIVVGLQTVPVRPGRLLVYVVVLMLAVSLGLYTFSPELEWYVGLSGVLHGLALLLAFFVLKALGRAVFIAALLLKVGWEQYTGADLATSELIGGAVIVDAHLYGLIGGVFVLLVLAGVSAAKRRA